MIMVMVVVIKSMIIKKYLNMIYYQIMINLYKLMTIHLYLNINDKKFLS